MRVLHTVTLTVATLLLAACGGNHSPGGMGGLGPTDPTTGNGAGNTPPPTQFHAMFNIASGIFPYPTDIYFATGAKRDGTLNIPASLAPVWPHLDSINQLDGFSTTGDISIRFSAPIDATTLAANVRVVQVAIDNATKATVGVHGILFPGLDYTIGVSPDIDAVGSVVLIHPLKPLVASTGATNNGYLVLVSDGVKAVDGSAAVPDSDYQLLRDTALADLLAGMTSPTCASLTNATLNGLCRLTFAHLAIGAQLPGPYVMAPNHMVVSFSFSTQSTTDTLGYIAQTTGPRAYTIAPTGLTTHTLGLPTPGIVDIYAGTLDIAYYLGIPSQANPIAPLNTPWTALNASPIDATSFRLTRFNPFPVAASAPHLPIPLLIMVPNNQPKPAAGWPVVIFQHGYPRDRTDALLIADSLAAAGFATVAIDLPLCGIAPPGVLDPTEAYAAPLRQPGIERTFDLDYQNNAQLGTWGHPDGKPDPTCYNFLNLIPSNNGALVNRDNARQGVADLIALVRTIPTIDLDPATNPGPDFDPNRIHMLGYSLGGFEVGMVLGLLGSEVKASALPSAASLLGTVATTSTRYSALIVPLLASQGVPPGSVLFRQFFRDWQAAFDGADSINYIANAVGPASGNRSIFMTEWVGGAGGFLPDNTVPNAVTDALANIMGLATVSAPGQNIIAGTNGAVVHFSQGVHGSLLDPSSSLPATIEIQKEMAFFFGSGGAAIVISDPSVIAP